MLFLSWIYGSFVKRYNAIPEHLISITSMNLAGCYNHYYYNSKRLISFCSQRASYIYIYISPYTDMQKTVLYQFLFFVVIIEMINFKFYFLKSFLSLNFQAQLQSQCVCQPTVALENCQAFAENSDNAVALATVLVFTRHHCFFCDELCGLICHPFVYLVTIEDRLQKFLLLYSCLTFPFELVVISCNWIILYCSLL